MSEQIEDILNGKIPKYKDNSIRGHHTYSVSKNPHLANKGAVIFPATNYEHKKGWHKGYRNSLPGKPYIEIDELKGE